MTTVQQHTLTAMCEGGLSSGQMAARTGHSPGHLRKTIKRWGLHKNWRAARKKRLTLYCRQCDGEIAGDGLKYCSPRCYGDSMRKPRPPCERCGRPVKEARLKTCSRRCAGIERRLLWARRARENNVVSMKKLSAIEHCYAAYRDRGMNYAA